MDCVHEDGIYSLRANSIYITKCPLNGGKPGTAILINRFSVNSRDCFSVSMSAKLSTHVSLPSGNGYFEDGFFDGGRFGYANARHVGVFGHNGAKPAGAHEENVA